MRNARLIAHHLVALAFCLDGGGYYHFGSVEFPEGFGAYAAHAGFQGAYEVFGTVGAAGGAEEEAVQGGVLADVDADAAGEFGVGGGHAPVEAAAGGFGGAGEGGADHDGVGAGDEGLAEVAAGANAAVGDDRDVAAGALVVDVAGVGALDGGGDLGDADAEHFAAGAGGAGADADQQAGDALFHQFERGVEADRVADQRGDADLVDQVAQDQSGLGAGVVAGGGDGGLDDEDVRFGVADGGGEARSPLRKRLVICNPGKAHNFILPGA